MLDITQLAEYLPVMMAVQRIVTRNAESSQQGSLYVRPSPQVLQYLHTEENPLARYDINMNTPQPTPAAPYTQQQLMEYYSKYYPGYVAQLQQQQQQPIQISSTPAAVTTYSTTAPSFTPVPTSVYSPTTYASTPDCNAVNQSVQLLQAEIRSLAASVSHINRSPAANQPDLQPQLSALSQRVSSVEDSLGHIRSSMDDYWTMWNEVFAKYQEGQGKLIFEIIKSMKELREECCGPSAQSNSGNDCEAAVTLHSLAALQLQGTTEQVKTLVSPGDVESDAS